MKEITLLGRTTHTVTRTTGELVSFHKGVPQYFADNDDVVSSIQRLQKKEPALFRVAGDIKNIKLPKDWSQLPKRELAAILDSLGRTVGKLVNHEDYVREIEKAIKENLINVVSDTPVGEGNMKALIKENAELKKSMADLEKEVAAQKKAFAETIAEFRTEMEQKIEEALKSKDKGK